MTESDYSFFLVSHSDSSKGGAYILSENPRLEVARRCRLLLKSLEQLKTWYPILLHGDDFAIDNGRAQLQFSYYTGDGREFCFQRARQNSNLWSGALPQMINVWTGSGLRDPMRQRLLRRVARSSLAVGKP